MNPLWIMGAMLVLCVIWLVWPLCWKPGNPLPQGIEDDASERHLLQAEKRRLLAEIKRQRAEQLEGRQDDASAQRLLADSEAALAQLLRQIDALGNRPAPAPVVLNEPAHWLAALLLAASVAAAASMLFRQQWRDPPAAPLSTMPKDIGEMLKRLEQRLVREPDSFTGWVMAGRTYASLGDKEKARMAWANAYRIKPDSREARFQHAIGLLELGEDRHYQAALAHFDALQQAQMDSVELGWYRGLALFSLKQFPQAKQQWQQVLEQLPPEGEEHDRVVDAIRRASRPDQEAQQ
ncbi:MAG: hypothetical protein E6R09_04745 [Rhodocyclaceae bacterium]|nr:MAG: hypothetical protein E6R09_04745 [Rhodocyclaceae bacterium]